MFFCDLRYFSFSGREQLYTSLGTQRCQGYLKLLARCLPALDTILPGNLLFAIKIDPLNLESPYQEHSSGSREFPNQNLRQIGTGVHQL